MITLILLGLIGSLTAVHAICIATDLPDKVPLSFGLEAASMFAAGIAALVFAVSSELDNSSIALLIALCLQGMYMLDAWLHGYKLVGFVVKDYSIKSPTQRRQHLHLH